MDVLYICSNNSNNNLICALLRLCSRQVLAQSITVILCSMAVKFINVVGVNDKLRIEIKSAFLPNIFAFVLYLRSYFTWASKRDLKWRGLVRAVERGQETNCPKASSSKRLHLISFSYGLRRGGPSASAGFKGALHLLYNLYFTVWYLKAKLKYI